MESKIKNDLEADEEEKDINKIPQAEFINNKEENHLIKIKETIAEIIDKGIRQENSNFKQNIDSDKTSYETIANSICSEEKSEAINNNNEVKTEKENFEKCLICFNEFEIYNKKKSINNNDDKIYKKTHQANQENHAADIEDLKEAALHNISYRAVEKIELSCKHFFCKECLNNFLHCEILKKNFPIKCCANNDNKICGIPIPHMVIWKNLDENQKDKYNDFTLKKYIESLNEAFFPCPTPGCPFGCEFEKGLQELFCPICKKSFCLLCKSEAHEDKSCNKLDDKEFLNLAKNKKYKQCPKCRAWIEKNEGCNHMTCKCRYEFCYICGEATKSNHTNCNYRFETNPIASQTLNFKSAIQNIQSQIFPIESNTGLPRTVLNNELNRNSEENGTVYFDINQPIASCVNSISSIAKEPANSDRTAQNPILISSSFCVSNNDSYHNSCNNNTRNNNNISLNNNNNIDHNDNDNNINFKTCNLPRKKDGTLDMRYKVNKQYSQQMSQIVGNNNSCKKIAFNEYVQSWDLNDNKNLDNSYSENSLNLSHRTNKEPDYSFYSCSNNNKNNYSISNSFSGYGGSRSGPTKKDGTLDMRYSINKEFANSQISNTSFFSSKSNNFSSNTHTNFSTSLSSSNQPRKSDGTLDMRYKVNKEYVRNLNTSSFSAWRK